MKTNELRELASICKTQPVYLRVDEKNEVYRMFGYSEMHSLVLVQRVFVKEGRRMLKPIMTVDQHTVQCVIPDLCL